MKRYCQKIGLCFLAVPILCLWAAPSQSAGIGFKNKLPVPIIIQGKSIVNNMLRNGLPMVIFPEKYAWDNNLPPGPRYVTIFDRTQPRKVLYQTPRNRPIPFQGKDLVFDIVLQKNKLGQVYIDLRLVTDPVELRQFRRTPR